MNSTLVIKSARSMYIKPQAPSPKPQTPNLAQVPDGQSAEPLAGVSFIARPASRARGRWCSTPPAPPSRAASWRPATTPWGARLARRGLRGAPPTMGRPGRGGSSSPASATDARGRRAGVHLLWHPPGHVPARRGRPAAAAGAACSTAGHRFFSDCGTPHAAGPAPARVLPHGTQSAGGGGRSPDVRRAREGARGAFRWGCFRCAGGCGCGPGCCIVAG
jgi:hypothetical protein